VEVLFSTPVIVFVSFFGLVLSLLEVRVLHFSFVNVNKVLADRLFGLEVRVLDYRSRGPGFDSRHYKKKVVGLERGPLSLVSTTEELLDRKVVAPV
jgi:hypothetical protein